MAKELRSMVGDREQRFIALPSTVSVRAAANEPPKIEGMGAMFNSETVIGRFFRERILPGAFKASIASGDIRVAFNHDPNYILGRTSAGTAKVAETSEGLRYEATPPASRADVVESIQRKDITGSSFTFTVENDEDEEWDYSETKQGKLPLRTIKRATLFETGPVAFPAYDNTTVSARAIGKVEEATRAQEAADRAAASDEVSSEAEEQATCEACAGTGKRSAAADAVVAVADPAKPTAEETRDAQPEAVTRDVDDLEDELNRLEFDL